MSVEKCSVDELVHLFKQDRMIWFTGSVSESEFTSESIAGTFLLGGTGV